MVVAKDYRIIETKQYNSTITLNIAQDNSVFFYLYLLKIKKIPDCGTRSILKMICPEASNMIIMLWFAYNYSFVEQL